MGLSPAIIAALIGAGTSVGVEGVNLGLQATGAFQPGSNQSQLQAQQAAQQKALQTQQQESFKLAAPNAQERAPGLAPDAFARLVQELSGSGGSLDLAKQSIFGASASDTQLPSLDATSAGSGTGLAAGGGIGQ